MLKIVGQETRVGAYTDKPFVCIVHIYVNHRIIKKGRWALTRMGAYSREYASVHRIPKNKLAESKKTYHCTYMYVDAGNGGL